jgi:hypothetical protein
MNEKESHLVRCELCKEWDQDEDMIELKTGDWLHSDCLYDLPDVAVYAIEQLIR